MIKNYMELVVDHTLPSVLEEYKDVCQCPRCIEDIKALTLNNLKPLYVVTEKGEVYVKINELMTQFQADVIQEIVPAIEMVSKNPRHQE